MNITIKIDAPELVGAIESLALALSGAGLPTFSPDTEAMEDVLAKEADAELAAKEKAEQEAKAKKQAADKKAAELAAKEKEAKAKADEAKKEEETETNEPGISLEVVRGKLAAHSALGRPQQLQIQDAISRFGVQKLTDVNPEDYAELLELSGVTE